MNQLDIYKIGSDLKTVQTLQRRHENLERELAPLEKKVNRVQLLASAVKNSHPNERDNVTQRENEIKGMCKDKDLYQDTKAHDDEFKKLTNLGKQLLKNNPSLRDVFEKIVMLDAEKAAILRSWNEKQNWLEQCLKLQVFYKEADNINAATSSHQALLEYRYLIRASLYHCLTECHALSLVAPIDGHPPVTRGVSVFDCKSQSVIEN
ncbi:hypothetical protein FQA39_LY00236 [Lamprigera yunnana]|nr:hypothetical protein FQA39_LY00236 [Lamprigera yunnana]